MGFRCLRGASEALQRDSSLSQLGYLTQDEENPLPAWASDPATSPQGRCLLVEGNEQESQFHGISRSQWGSCSAVPPSYHDNIWSISPPSPPKNRKHYSLSLIDFKTITPIPLRVFWPWEVMGAPASLLPELSSMQLEPEWMNECKGICTLSLLFRALGWEKWAWPSSFCEHGCGCLKLWHRGWAWSSEPASWECWVWILLLQEKVPVSEA